MVLTIEQGEARQRCTSKAGRQLRKLLLLRKWKWFWEGRGGWRGNGCLSKVWDYSHGVQNSWATFGAVLNNVNVDICAVAIFLISLLSTQRLIQPLLDKAAQVVPAWQPGCEKMEREWENKEEMEREEEMERAWENGESFTLFIFSFSLYFLPLYPFPISEIVSFCHKMLNRAPLSRMSQKT